MSFGDTSFVIILLISYLIGSIPTGYLLTKWFKLGDIRKVGSGNIGATNVLRSGNKKIAIATLALDMLKGFLPTLMVHFFILGTNDTVTALSGIAAVLGHCFPMWLKFKGGKGVATGIGVFAAYDWKMAVCVSIIWIVTAKISRLSSLGALTSFACAPFLAALFCGDSFWGFWSPYVGGVLVITFIVWFRHIPNIQRLSKGKELPTARQELDSLE